MSPGPEADRVLLAHMRDCIDRILEYTTLERSRFDASHLVQDAVIRNLQTLAESSQRGQQRFVAEGIHAGHKAAPALEYRDARRG